MESRVFLYIYNMAVLKGIEKFRNLYREDIIGLLGEINATINAPIYAPFAI